MNIELIRRNECISMTEAYMKNKLYKSDGWLKSPIKTVRDILPLLRELKDDCRILDLGCGVGRNSIFLANELSGCTIDCVDILEIAIEKLAENAMEHGVDDKIKCIVDSIESFRISASSYDLIMAISALEHVESEDVFATKLVDIRDGVRHKGVVCLVVNTDINECNIISKESLSPQFEVNLSHEKVRHYLFDVFSGWTVIKDSLSHQEYELPRGTITSRLSTNVVTFVAQKTENITLD